MSDVANIIWEEPTPRPQTISQSSLQDIESSVGPIGNKSEMEAVDPGVNPPTQSALPSVDSSVGSMSYDSALGSVASGVPTFAPLPTIIIPSNVVPQMGTANLLPDVVPASVPAMVAMASLLPLSFAAAVMVGGIIANTMPNGWRPPQWSGGPGASSPQLIYLKTNVGGLFFDAVLRVQHETSLKITEHPVQTGANLTDHSYVLPARITLEIGMSDAMDSFVPGQYGGGATKSVNAYNKFVALQAKRQPLQVVTRLNVYQNMLIEHISASDDVRTLYGLRCTITLRQIFLAKVQTTTTASSQPQTTSDPTSGGSPQTDPAPTAPVSQPGAGDPTPTTASDKLAPQTTQFGTGYEGGTSYDPGPSTLGQGDYDSMGAPSSSQSVNTNAVQQSMTGQVSPQSPTPNPNGMAVMSSTGQAS